MPLSKASRADASCESIQLPFFFLFDLLLTSDPIAAGWDTATIGEGISVNGIAFSSGLAPTLAHDMPQKKGSYLVVPLLACLISLGERRWAWDCR